MKDFPGYEKIAESLDRWLLDPSAFRLLRKATWVVTEKIHGANFCISVDDKAIRCANRRAWLSPDESFFGYQALRDAPAANVRELFRRVRNDYPKMVRLYLYGELFGGGYPHPEVAPAPGVQPVQTGVWYTPDIRFCAFDMRIETGEGHRCYVDYADVLKRCTEVCIFAAAPLFVGRYEAAMEQGIRFDSTIPRALGLPALPSGTNLAEGVVVKPYQEIAITNAKGERIRPVLKRKIEEFAEDKRFHAAAKWENPAVPVVTPLDLLQWEASCRIVENRLNAAASKIGFVPHKTPGKASLLFTLLVNEVLDEVQAALPDASAALAPSEHETLRIHVVEEVRCLLKTR